MEKDISRGPIQLIRRVEVKKKIDIKKNKKQKSNDKKQETKYVKLNTANLSNDIDSQGENVVKWAEASIGFLNSSQVWGNATVKGWPQAQEKIHQAEIIEVKKINKSHQNKKITYLQFEEQSPNLPENQNIDHFEDSQFPPNLISLTGQWGYLPKYKDVKWEKVTEKISNCKIFKDRISHKDTTQGKLGDCYFLAGIAALAERPDRIFNLFLVRQINEKKYFSVKILFQGRWRVIDLDEYFPFQNKQPVFTRAKGDELWVMIMQKAWAKLYTSYMRISAGHAQEPLHDMTGAPITFFRLKDMNGVAKEALWKYLLTASKRQYAMCASSNSGSDTKMSETGIVQGHAYTLLNAILLDYNKTKVRLVQLRNPWGKKQSTGNWCDRDKRWKQVSEQEKKRVCYDPTVEDGIFFIQFSDFLREYRAIFVAQVNDNASYLYETAKDPKIEGVYFKIDIKQQGAYSIQVDKPPIRSFTVKQQQRYRYPLAMVRLFNLNTCQSMYTFSDTERLTSRKYNLMKGSYIAYVIIYFDKTIQKDYDVVLAVYSQIQCMITLADNNEKKKIAGLIGDDNNKKRAQTQPKPISKK